MNHIDEKTLELYVLDADEVKEQRDGIEGHLNECPGCAALQREMMEYYSEVQKLNDERTKTSTRALTLRSMIVRMPYTGHGPLQQATATLPARVVLFAIRHYVVSSMSALVLVIAALLALYPAKLNTDTNPAYARANNEFLVAYNKEGKEVWRKHVGPGYEASGRPPEEYVATIDVDQDGKNEIIGIFGSFGLANSSFSDNAVMCFNCDGTSRWNFGFHCQMTFGRGKFSDRFEFIAMTAGDLERNGRCEIAAVARHNPYWPTSVVLLDARSGALLHEYWHCGWLWSAKYEDLDGDGVEELIYAGENNSFEKSALIIIDPRKIDGFAPSTAQYTPQDSRPGLEKYYLLLPSSDLRVPFSHPRPHGGYLFLEEDGSIEIRSEEITDGVSYDLIYYFNRTMKCIVVQASDSFMKLHQRLEAEGKTKTIADAHYFEQLRQGVLYWDGEKFVHEPTMNKRYVEAMNTKALP
jgi:hypothetical protein